MEKLDKMQALSEAEQLEKALEILEERGWSKDGMITEEGAVCIIGAVALARGCWDGSLADIDDRYTNYITHHQCEAVLSVIETDYRGLHSLNRSLSQDELNDLIEVVYTFNDTQCEDFAAMKKVVKKAITLLKENKLP